MADRQIIRNERQLTHRDQIVPGMRITRIHSGIGLSYAADVLSTPDDSGKFRIRIFLQRGGSYESDCHLGDAGIVPYDSGSWNGTNWTETAMTAAQFADKAGGV